MRKLSVVGCVSFFVLAPLIPMAGHGQDTGADMTVDAPTRAAVIDGLLKELSDFYIFPDVAAKMAQDIRQRQRRNEYESITSARRLAEALTADLRDVSHDRHLAVNYSATMLRPFPFPPPPPPAELVARQRAGYSQTNFGFTKAERLGGNIGYLDLRSFMPPAWIGETLTAAMTFLGNTSALILDLRHNGGGGPDSVALICSYFFEEPVRLNDVYTRPSNETRQSWTLASVPGVRFVNRDLYILTSNATFSAAEDFTYAMKNLKRATIVGEVTGGGAHPVGSRRVADHFLAAIPMARSISPITHTDWEGVGVEPDIKAPSPQALARAHLIALEKLEPGSSDPSMREEIAVTIERLRAELRDAGRGGLPR
jgi:hypothetical protein